MAEKNVRVNEAQPIVYQAPNKETGATVIAEVYTPAGTKDVENFPDLTLAEVGTTGVYNGAFTPNAAGEWIVLVHKQNGDGQVVKRYSVGSHNLDSVGSGVSAVAAGLVAVDAKVDALGNAVASLDTPPMVA